MLQSANLVTVRRRKLRVEVVINIIGNRLLCDQNQYCVEWMCHISGTERFITLFRIPVHKTHSIFFADHKKKDEFQHRTGDFLFFFKSSYKFLMTFRPKMNEKRFFLKKNTNCVANYLMPLYSSERKSCAVSGYFMV